MLVSTSLVYEIERTEQSTERTAMEGTAFVTETFLFPRTEAAKVFGCFGCDIFVNLHHNSAHHRKIKTLAKEIEKAQIAPAKKHTHTNTIHVYDTLTVPDLLRLV